MEQSLSAVTVRFGDRLLLYHCSKQEVTGFEVVADRDELAVCRLVRIWACLALVLRTRFRFLITTVCRQLLQVWTCFHRLSLLKHFVY